MGIGMISAFCIRFVPNKGWYLRKGDLGLDRSLPPFFSNFFMLNNLSVLGTVRLYFVCGGNLISRWDFPDIEKNWAAVCKKFRSMYIKPAAEKH